jgi:hypothetical protein
MSVGLTVRELPLRERPREERSKHDGDREGNIAR